MQFFCKYILVVAVFISVWTHASERIPPSCAGILGASDLPRYPTTGQIGHRGFPSFLKSNMGENRRNLKLFALELSDRFNVAQMSLVNSGSSANLVAAAAVRELTGGGHAIAAGFSFPTTLSSLMTSGFDVSLVDIKPGEFTIDPEAFKRAIRADTKVVVVTHFLGFPVDMKRIAEIAIEHNIKIIQDACETMNLNIHGRQAHEFGDFTTWSFYHPHHLSAYGGGAVISNNLENFRLTDSIAHWGRACTCHIDPDSCSAPEGMDHNFWYERVGYNLEMSELNAAFGRFQLLSFDKQEVNRLWRYEILLKSLRDIPGVRVYPRPDTGGSPFVFPITLEMGSAREVAQILKSRGVEVRSLMGGNIADHPAFKDLPHDGLANVSSMGARSFFVGIHQTLPRKDVVAVAKILREVLVSYVR
ncbi:MAG: DegT/DnrJ/EryC1/StrS family aminotransferase [Bdellovibrionales bacterium]|nr:DegT/DnrJ/EryC1/StrS family aminotransferase [Bdellovibrionales bacterium]